ncbi:hypothetical protein EVAR_74047_1 [Eumeta japonica]|uniref:Uncharacterized protein n=1 Tax=Eumeta variegata TaxID=151549 RepID=A0A4C1TQ29_EUMVA|nr:hypothetical protein EVAR_74047_1 [Eumeta japonica]
MTELAPRFGAGQLLAENYYPDRVRKCAEQSRSFSLFCSKSGAYFSLLLLCASILALRIKRVEQKEQCALLIYCGTNQLNLLVDLLRAMQLEEHTYIDTCMYVHVRILMYVSYRYAKKFVKKMFTTENIKQTTVNIQRSKRKEPLIRLKEQSKRAKIKNKCALLKRAERKKRSKRNEQAIGSFFLAPLFCALRKFVCAIKECAISYSAT